MKGVLRGSLLSVAMRWTDRLIGLFSTLVLARLLLPQDFGVIAMASLVAALADVLFNLGVHVALIQHPSPEQAHYDTAWTIGLLQSALSALVVCLLAPWAALYFHEPRVQAVTQVLGLSMLVSGCENIAVVNFQKNMQFGQDFLLMFYKRFAGFVITLLFAWLLRSYWALVLGALAGRVVGVVCSYAMQPQRARLGLTRWREILGVSQWMLAHTTGTYFEGQLHRAVVGRISSAGTMGAYSMAGDIASMPSSELLMPINRVMFPAFVRVQAQPGELHRVFLQAQGLQSLIAVPACVGLALVAPQLVALMLGPQWGMAVPFLRILALAYLASAMLSCATWLLVTLGHIKMLSAFIWAQVLLFGVLALALSPGLVALQVAWLRLGVSALSDLSFVLLLLHYFKPLRLHDVLQGVQRPLLASAVMALGLLLLEGQWGATPLPWVLAAKVLIGAALYSACMGLLWWAAGQPDGAAEADVLRYLTKSRQEEHP